MLIPSLRIENFRVFRELSVEGLGDVNLVTGRNNVGKTALLEAVRFIAARGNPAILLELLRGHDEVERRDRDVPEAKGAQRLVDARALFHGRLRESGAPRTLRIASGRDELSVTYQSYGPDGVSAPGPVALSDTELWERPPPSLVLDGFAGPSGMTIERLSKLAVTDWKGLSPMVPATGLGAERLALWWDEVSLTDAESRIIECLRLVAPVERVAFVDVGSGRVPMVRRRDEREPAPLRSLGEGMTRLFSFALAVERARESGVLLIDEIENGVHYSVLPDLWRFLFATARANNVQVFATTHSWDCIAAFAEVAAEDRESVGALVRLREKQGTIVPTVFNEQELKVIEREHVEVR